MRKHTWKPVTGHSGRSVMHAMERWRLHWGRDWSHVALCGGADPLMTTVKHGRTYCSRCIVRVQAEKIRAARKRGGKR